MIELLTENAVVKNVSEWLRVQGYTIKGTCYDNTPGDDIHAVDPNGLELFVECKGAVSKRNQPLNHWRNASGAVFNALRDAVALRQAAAHAIALPDIDELHALLDGFRRMFSQYGITVFWVSEDGQVTAWWSLESKVASSS